jgi:3'(2'), 5'-bisphosphate nucleotidase
VVDPLDGTKEFLKRNGEFTVNIALIQVRNRNGARLDRQATCQPLITAPLPPLKKRQGNAPVLGVLHVPVTGETYFAVEGRGAFVRRKVGRDVCGFDAWRSS